jgi:hypothetical protein
VLENAIVAILMHFVEVPDVLPIQDLADHTIKQEIRLESSPPMRYQVRDDRHENHHTGTEAWRGDSVQLAFDPALDRTVGHYAGDLFCHLGGFVVERLHRAFLTLDRVPVVKSGPLAAGGKLSRCSPQV